MKITEAQDRSAKSIHDLASQYPYNQQGEEDLFSKIPDFKDDFSLIIASIAPDQFDRLCEQYPGFDRVVKKLSRVAENFKNLGIESIIPSTY